MADDPHATPITEGHVGSVNEVNPPWHFGPVPGNIDAAGAQASFSGTPEGQCGLPTSSPDPHTESTTKEAGGWRVPYRA